MTNEAFELSTIRAIQVAPARLNDSENNYIGNKPSYLDSEKVKSDEKARKRNQIFEFILQNQPTQLSWIGLLFYPFAIIFISFLFLVPFCFVPAHDLVIYPEYWYEILFHGTYMFIPFYWFWTYLAGAYLNLSCSYHWKHLVIVSFVASTIMFSFTISTYYFWTKALLYQYPIPFCGLITCTLMNLSFCPTVWYLIPSGLRKNRGLKNRIKNFILHMISGMTVVLFYQFLVANIKQFEGPYQPLFALIFPVTREFVIWLFTKMVRNCSNGDERGALIILSYGLNINHTINLCYVIGSVTDERTTWALLGFDFLINMYLTMRIVWLRKKNQEILQPQTILLQDLAITELVEFHAPLSFIMVTALAYFSPIGVIIGNVSNSYWAYNAIEDIGETLQKMGVFFLVDFTSTLSSASILWFSYKINLWKAFLVLQEEFFNGFTFILGFYSIAVRLIIYNYVVLLLIYITFIHWENNKSFAYFAVYECKFGIMGNRSDNEI